MAEKLKVDILGLEGYYLEMKKEKLEIEIEEIEKRIVEIKKLIEKREE